MQHPPQPPEAGGVIEEGGTSTPSLLAVHPDRTQYGARLSAVNPEHSDVAIVFSRHDRTYRPTELVEGAVIVTAKDGWYHQEIDLVISGEVRMRCPPPPPVFGGGPPEPPSSDASPPRPGANEPKSSRSSASDSSSYARSTRSSTLVERSVLLKPRGRLDAGMHRLSFTFPLLGIGGEPLLDTYRGKYIEVVYTATVRIERGVFSRTLEKNAEFAVRTHPAERPTPGEEENELLLAPVPIRITPASITENAVVGNIKIPTISSAVTPRAGSTRRTPNPVAEARGSLLPSFHIRGQFDSTLWSLDDPITGEVTVVSSAKSIKFVEVRLNRVEGVCQETSGAGEATPLSLAGHPSSAGRVGAGGGFIVSRTEVQTHRIAEGDVPRGVPLPVHLILPKLLVCPMVASGLAFRIGWELEVQVLFFDGTMVTESYPVVLYRGE